MWIRLVVVALFLAGIVALVARAIVAMRRRDRRAAFGASLPQALQLLTSSLRSGHDTLQALDAVAVGADEPVRGEFQRVIIRTRLGRDLSDAIRELAQRMQSTDLERIAAAIDIHRETGGDNLADILDRGSRDHSLLADVCLSRGDASGTMGDR
jgi:tight adherence protein B